MNRKDLPAPNTTCEVCGRPYRMCKKCIEMRNRGIETWRIHCDSVECYMIYMLVNTDDISKITEEEYDRAISEELPENRDPLPEVKKKLKEIKNDIESRRILEKYQKIDAGSAFKNSTVDEANTNKKDNEKEVEKTTLNGTKEGTFKLFSQNKMNNNTSNSNKNVK